MATAVHHLRGDLVARAAARVPIRDPGFVPLAVTRGPGPGGVAAKDRPRPLLRAGPALATCTEPGL